MEKRNSFSGKIGFILAAAGSAVGLGNIWRFPYLAAKNGGGIFLVVYLVLALTFGYTLLISEVSIGRKTKQSPLTAYGKLKEGWDWLGVMGALVPFIILPYYCVIGGWVLKYTVAFITGHGADAATDGYFTGFITAQYEPIVYNVIFLAATAAIIYRGVNKGIEKMSTVLMPVLIVLIVGVAIFSLTVTHTGDDGTLRTGLDGLKVYVIPNLSGMTVHKFFGVVLDAMGQLFFSISVAMGIMVAYGSYFSDDEDLPASVAQIEIFDTAVAFLAGVVIIPAVFVFMGQEGMESSGPGLIFVVLPKVFVSMGVVGNIVGAVFFIMVFLAALTSSISVLEAVVSSLIDGFKLERKKATIFESLIALGLGIVVCLGYNIFYFELKLPNGAVAQILDIMDFISNNILMPIVAIGTCVLIGWMTGPGTVISEAARNGERFSRKNMYIIMIKYVCPVLLFILFLKSLGIVNL